MVQAWGQIGADGVKTYPLHAGQSAIMRSRARFTAALAGTGGGKTCIGPLWIAQQIPRLIAAGVHPIMGLVLAPTYQIMSRATAPTLVDTFRGTDLQGTYIEGKKQYILPRDLGTLWTLSADNPEGIEGGQMHLAWLDEAGQLALAAWYAVQARTGLNRAPVLITTTPYRLNWLKKEVLDRSKADPDYKSVIWRSIDNPAYPREEYLRAQRTLPKSLFAMRYEGRFSAQEGLIFNCFNYDFNVRPCLYNKDLPILVGCDFNVSPMAWVLCHRKGDTIEVFDELFLRDITTQRTLAWLNHQYKDHRGGWLFFGDATSRARKTSAATSDYAQIANDEHFVAAGRTIHIGISNPICVDRFAATNARFCNAADERHLFIDPKCENLISDLESRYFKEGTREPQDVGDAGHSTDALGYIIHRLFPIRLRLASGAAHSVTMTGMPPSRRILRVRLRQRIRSTQHA